MLRLARNGVGHRGEDSKVAAHVHQPLHRIPARAVDWARSEEGRFLCWPGADGGLEAGQRLRFRPGRRRTRSRIC